MCSIFFCTEIYRISKNQIEVMIPSRPGWYYDECCGWVFLEKLLYKNLSKDDLPPLMCKRSIGDKERSVDEVYGDLKAIIETDLHRKVLLAVRLISAILMPLEKLGIHVRTIVAVVVEMVSDMRVAAAILKTGDFEKYDSVSLNSTIVDINKEIGGARDGVAAIIGPLTAKEAKLNAKNVNYIRDAAIGANGADKTVRSVVSLIGRFIPEDLSPDLIFYVKFSNKFDSIDEKMLRSLVIEFEAGYIHYIENNFSKVNGLVRDAVENYKANPKSDIVRDKEGLYIAFLVVQMILSECFDIKLFNDEEFDYIKNMFKESFTEIDVPEYTVRDQFIDATNKLLNSNRFTIIERQDANKINQADKIALILDRKKRFLSFPMTAMELLAEMIPTVKDGAELAGVLKICNSIFCTDNGARQITTSTGRTAFYSVYLSEFGDDILDIIDSLDTEEFFLIPEDVPRNFVPIVWRNGRCAGIVIDGKGLPNPHINISGLSGMGKNRGAYKTAEGYWRLKSKVIFLDIKGCGIEEALRDMKCDLNRYCFHNLKTDGLPFPIFNLSAFSGKNAKVSYIMNVIGAAVGLTDKQIYDLTAYIESIVSENSDSFSLHELFEKLTPKKEQRLRGKLQPLLHLINAYTPKDNKYKYSSCVEFVNDCSKITILSIAQESESALRSTVYSMLQAVFEHRVIDSRKRLVIYADEIQKYTSDSPFRKLYAESREFNTCMVAMTQEYRATGDEIRKMSSNAAMELFYSPTNDSEGRVSKKIGKKYCPYDHRQNGVGYIWALGYFWSKTDNCHKFVTLRGMNDDNRFNTLQSYPENWYGTGY